MFKKGYFSGWYFKHQASDKTISFIPGINVDTNGEKKAFIQIITNTDSYNLNFPFQMFKIEKSPLRIEIGSNIFSEEGIKIDIESDNICVKGELEYGDLTPLKHDIMGPFSVLPFMQCKHGIISMHHHLKGKLTINSQTISFDNGIGYIESDSGSSFPKSYIWMQCNNFENEDCSVMVSIADIPFMGLNFKGCICAVVHKNKEYRLATYNGVKIVNYSKQGIIIKNGRYRFEVNFTESSSLKLIAPNRGSMNRTIHESPACKGLYRFYVNDKILFALSSNSTAFEYVE